MQTLFDIHCRFCAETTKHLDLDGNNEFNLPAHVRLVQCSRCGLVGVSELPHRSDNGHL